MPPIATTTGSSSKADSAISRPWFRERAARLHRFFRTVERRRERGQSLRSALQSFVRSSRGCTYRTAPKVRMRFTRPTLRTNFYHWLRNGRTAECLALKFAGKLAPVTGNLARSFVLACATPGTLWFSQAGRRVRTRKVSAHRILATLPPQTLAKIKAEMKARRVAEMATRRSVKRIEAAIRKRLATDRCRARRISKLARALNDC